MAPPMSHRWAWLAVVLMACCAARAAAATTQLQLLAQWSAIPTDAGTEQVAFDDVEKVAYLIGNKVLYVVDLSPAALLNAAGAPATPAKNLSLLANVTLATTLTDVVFCGGYLAVSAEGPTKVLPGSVTIFNRYRRNGPGSLEKLTQLTVGALPDQIEFSRDCTTILVSNEAEPLTYTPASLENDPEGSVSVINLFFCDTDRGEGPYAYASEAAAIAGQYNEASTSSRYGRDGGRPSREPYRSAPDYWKSRSAPDCRGARVYGSVRTAGFQAWNNKRSQLLAQGIKLTGINATVAQDLEPEYTTFAAGEKIAFVGLQENGAIAVLDVERAVITAIHGLGFKNHSVSYNALDPTDNPLQAKIGTWPVFGMYQPDEMRSFRHNGVDYIVTANEGDARDWPGLREDSRISSNDVKNSLSPTAFPDQSFTQNTNAGRLNVLAINGKPYPPFSDPTNTGNFSKLFSFGARSFSIWRLNYPAGNEYGRRDTAVSTLSLVYDSGDQLEQFIKANLYDIYNSNGKNASFDQRSPAKGPEPEGVTIGPCATSPSSYEERGSTSNNRRREYVDPKPEERLCLFLGTERASVIFVYDITNPKRPVFQGYARPPQPTPSDASRLTGPEGMSFNRYRLPSGESFNIILAAYEAASSGLGVYKVVEAP